ncbi:FAD-dependent monooxygenase [Microlunatus sp. Y2014]|uniref:FAD-dependent monooxygenase n=1 Tax=Microlunatus sp. Y2014 TaxID=3418488 RepID=UPI003DA701CB
MTVLIVGGGPTGMAAALVLTVNGVDCRILERRTRASNSSRALGLQAKTMEHLAGLGLADDVQRVSYELGGASIMKGDREVVHLPWIPPDSRYPYTYVVPQTGLEEILRGELARLGVPIETGAEVDRVEQDDDRVTVTLTGGGSRTGEWLIGADGARSRVRTELGIDFVGDATGETYFLADAILQGVPTERDSAMWLGPEGPLMLMSLPGREDLWRIFVDRTDRSRHGELGEPDIATLQQILADRGHPGIRLTELGWTSIFRTRIQLAERYRAGRTFLAGDAAHVFPPFGGQGMNLGIQDAANLAWRLARVIWHGSPTSLLDAYERERRPVAAATITDVEGRRKVYALRHPLARGARDLLFRAFGSNRRAAAAGSRQNAQLATSYRERSWRDRFAGDTLRVGDRAPDGPLADGRLLDHVGLDHHLLLLFGDDLAPQHPDLVVVRADRTGELATRYGMTEGGYVVVRPDGHIAELGQGRPSAAALALR